MITDSSKSSVTAQKTTFDTKVIGPLSRVWRLISRYRTIVVFFSLVLISTVLSPHFLTFGNITNVLRQASFNGLLATGMTFVILTRGIDLSGGSILGVAMMTAGMFGGEQLMTGGVVGGQHFLVAIGAGLLVGALLGLINGWVIAKLRIEPFVVTLAMLTVARGIALVVSGGHLVVGTTEPIRFLGTGFLLGMPLPVWIMAATFLIAYIVLRWTPFGRRTYATGANEEAARLAGINVDFHKMMAYVISGFLAAVAGIILLARLNVADPLSGTMFELDAIAATVIGGTTFDGGKGGIGGTVIGVMILAMLNNIMNLMNISPYMQQIVKGLVLAGAVIMNEYRRRR